MTFGEYTQLKILVVDDRDLIFDGLKSCLAPYPNLELVGFVTDGLSVYEECFETQTRYGFYGSQLTWYVWCRGNTTIT